MIRPMLRISWLLVLLVLLKLGMGMNSAAVTLPTQHPVQGHLADSHPCHENTATEVSKNKAPTTETAASSDAQSTSPMPLTTATHLAESTCGDCQWCCAWGLTARKVSLAPATPASPPQGFTLSWISQSLQPELRPPLV
jgi:hypothetical protein